MKHKIVLSMSLVAMIMVACSKSEEETAKTEESMSDKTASVVSEMKEAGKQVVDSAAEKGQEIGAAVSEKTKSAAEQASEFVKKGSSEVVEAVEDAKQGLDEKVGDIKQKASDLMSDATSREAEGTAMVEDATADKLAEAGAATAALGSAAQPKQLAVDLELGKSVYTGKCAVCHGSGAAGAPKLDDASWTERKAQGMEVMVEHAIKGFQGAKGYMPAKGGFSALSDDEVKAAVGYMVSQTQ